jgi:lipopolysaccharide transport system ATP-binding protein
VTGTPAIEFRGVRRSFAVYPSALARLADALAPFARRDRPAVEVLAGLDFAIAEGESVGVVGVNGAGKSTILHLAAGLLSPSSGEITVRGEVASLLGLGSTFLPELTGRENVRFYLEVVVPAAERATDRERAVEGFAGIGEAFDRPVRTYSDGMFLRLAFACAATQEPDVLLLDEVFAVGDARFQQKCFRRLRQLRAAGTTIVLVTHLVHHLSGLCDRVLLIDRGRIVFDGAPGPAIDRYYQLCFAPGTERDGGADEPNESDEFRYGDGGGRILDPIDGVAAVRSGETVRLAFDVEFVRPTEEAHVGLTCSTTAGIAVYATTTALLGQPGISARPGERRRVEIEFAAPLAVEDLFVDLSLFEMAEGELRHLDVRIGVVHIQVARPAHFLGISDLQARIRAIDVPAQASA